MRWTEGLALVETVSRWLVGLAFAVLIGAVMVQVLGRGVFNDSPVWTEELSRFALIYLTAFGLGLSYRTGDLVNVDLVCEALPRPLPWLLRLLSALATAFLAAMLIEPAWRYTAIGAFQTSPALEWRMDLIHGAILVSLVSLLVFSLARVAGMLTGAADGRPVSGRDEAP
ncbi:MAG: TRAP transporter small permease subunit [Candidatus Competibacteraceae bacterium]|nr:TRAP transporter small permease subunit [Candidatus Competibacteraceae bacterium]